MSSKPCTSKLLSQCPLRVGITGGIGSGKTYVCKKLETAGYPVFYCDDEAKRIIRTSLDVRQDLTALIGANVYDANGQLVKSVLAAYICASTAQAARVDAIVHPRVAEAFRAWTDAQESPIVFMECALLFESGFDKLVDSTAHVTVPETLRLQRVMARDHITAEKARAWMDLQMPEADKSARATYLIPNDNDAHLEAALKNLEATLKERRALQEAE